MAPHCSRVLSEPRGQTHRQRCELASDQPSLLPHQTPLFHMLSGLHSVDCSLERRFRSLRWSLSILYSAHQCVNFLNPETHRHSFTLESHCISVYWHHTSGRRCRHGGRLHGATSFVCHCRHVGNVERARLFHGHLRHKAEPTLAALGAALTESCVPPELAQAQDEQENAKESEDGHEDVILDPAD